MCVCVCMYTLAHTHNHTYIHFALRKPLELFHILSCSSLNFLNIFPFTNTLNSTN